MKMSGSSKSSLLSAMLVATATAAVLLCMLATDRQAMVGAYPTLDIMLRGDCNDNADLRLNCERCAKYTRSHEIYKKCCKSDNDGEHKDTVRFWCERFLLHEIDQQFN